MKRSQAEWNLVRYLDFKNEHNTKHKIITLALSGTDSHKWESVCKGKQLPALDFSIALSFRKKWSKAVKILTEKSVYVVFYVDVYVVFYVIASRPDL